MAEYIAEKENADKYIVSLAALLHDVDDIKLSPNTNKNKDNARCFLKENHVDEDTINLICEIISEISYKGVDTVPGKTLEAKIVQDADRLDALGAIGIARAFAYGGNHNRLMYDPDIKPHLNMNEEEYNKGIESDEDYLYSKDKEGFYYLKITVAGMPKGCYPFVNFKNFKVGASYKGKKQPKRVPGGVVLNEIDFTIKE